jgi:bacillithiol biosynthesis deacetylase BshB1
MSLSTPLDAPLDVLVVAPHPDDAEISTGGTLIACGRRGLRTGVVELTNGEPTPHGSPELRQAETDAASKILGLTWRGQLDLPNRKLESSLAARRQLAGVFRLTRPRVILAPYWDDAHPDHIAATQLTDAARFWAKLSRTDLPGIPYHPPRIFYYWSIHLRNHPAPSFVFDISDVMDEKMQAVECYKSQFHTGKSQEFPTALDDIRDRGRYWGWAIHAKYGEPFASRESVRVVDFFSSGLA